MKSERIRVGAEQEKSMATQVAEIAESSDPVRVMRYFRSLWLAYQGLQ